MKILRIICLFRGCYWHRTIENTGKKSLSIWTCLVCGAESILSRRKGTMMPR